jgi:exodeoxyribonuclease III
MLGELSNLKVITWNCNMAFRKKYQNILSHEPDLLIIPECEHPEKFKDTFYSDVVWIGNNKNKGLGVFSFNDIRISLHKSYCEYFKYILPIEVTVNNEKIMNLIAVWAQKNDEKDTKRAAIPVLNKNTCGRRLNFLIFRNNFISLST